MKTWIKVSIVIAAAVLTGCMSPQLLDDGADMHEKSKTGLDALHLAAGRHCADIVKQLKWKMPCAKGRTPLDAADTSENFRRIWLY
jgi:hypothetical protein